MRNRKFRFTAKELYKIGLGAPHPILSLSARFLYGADHRRRSSPVRLPASGGTEVRAARRPTRSPFGGHCDAAGVRVSGRSSSKPAA